MTIADAMALLSDTDTAMASIGDSVASQTITGFSVTTEAAPIGRRFVVASHDRDAQYREEH
jgi:hypothetical protein